MTRATTALKYLLVAIFAAGILIPVITNDAPLGGFVGIDYADRSDVPTNLPHMTPDVAAAHPGCTAHIVAGRPVLTMDRDGNVERMTFDEIAAATHGFTTAPAAHTYVIASC